jgi:hypothetical protein
MGRLLSARLVPTFADRWLHVVSMTDPYGRILGFLYRSGFFFFQVAPQLYSRGWVDPVPDQLLLRKCGSAGNRTQTSGSGVFVFLLLLPAQILTARKMKHGAGEMIESSYVSALRIMLMVRTQSIDISQTVWWRFLIVGLGKLHSSGCGGL